VRLSANPLQRNSDFINGINTRFLAALARTSLRHGRIPAIFNGRVCCRGNDVPVLDANPSALFPFLDCPQHGYKELMLGGIIQPRNSA
jgi:hypothetical protein